MIMEPGSIIPPRQSIDSTRSTSPFIQKFLSQPPLHYSPSHEAKAHDAAKKINMSIVILACRAVILISAFAVGITFATLRAYTSEMIALVVLTWLSAAWQVIPLTLRKSSFRISLVLGNGKVVDFGRQSNGEEDRPRRRFLGIFWVDFLLFAAVFSLNIFNSCQTIGRYRSALGANWVPISFQIAVLVLTISPTLAKAHFRFETTKVHGISLP
ncbi:hypothetical protein F4803DRAFT_223420 [Xylaria telfairii]|nr:hypothetical protein F4803DRAFT_223420 [Xylaria telfairii]